MSAKEFLFWVAWWLCVGAPATLLAAPFWKGRTGGAILVIVIGLAGLLFLLQGRDRIRAFLAVAGFTGIIGLSRLSLELIRGWESADKLSLTIQGIAYAAGLAIAFIGISRLEKADSKTRKNRPDIEGTNDQ